MKTTFFRHTAQLLTLLLVSATLLNAQQLKLGNNPSVIQKSAILELESNSQGVLLPRITDTTLATIKTAPDGMIIFLTLNNSLCIRANGQWHKLIPEGEAISSMNGSTASVQTITATSNAAAMSMTTIGANHFLNLPDATTSYSGFISTGAQTFAGAKTFNGNLTAYQDLLLPNIVVDNTKDSVLLIDAGKVWKKQLTGLPPTGAASGDLTGTYPSPVIAAGAVTGAKMAQGGATTGQILKWNGTTWAPAADDNTGTLTSVGLTAPSLFTVTNSPLTANGSIALGLQTQTANTIFAGPTTGAVATPTFRTLVAADIPALPFTKISGTVPIAQGGTGLTAVGAAGTVLTSNGTSLTYTAPSATLAGDVTGASGTNTIAAKAVTYAKIQDVNTQKILGRYTAGAGSVQEVSLDNSLKLTTAGILYADSSLAIWNASKILGRTLSPLAPATGQVLKYDGTTWAPAADDNTGSLSSVGLTAPSLFTVTNSPLTANGSIGLGLQTQTANTIFAGPGTGAAATPTFRALVAGDVPSLPFTKITGVVPISQGGTGLSTAGTVGYLLVSTGSGLVYMDPVLGGDVINNAFANSIAAKAVTYAKIQDVTAQKILGRYAATNGSTQEISLDNSLKLTTGGILYADSSLAIWNASKLLGRTLSPLAPASGQVLKYNGTTWAPAADDNTGSLTSVGLTAPAIFTVTNSPLTANGNIALGLQTQTANTIFAGPGTGAAASPIFRTLVAGDIPALPFTKITGTVPVAQGGTSLTAVGAAGTVLSSDGTNLSYVTPSVTLAGDVTGASGTNTITAKAVTYAKIQDVNTQKILGRYTAGTGVVQEVSLDNSLKLNTAGTLYADSSLAIWNASKILGRTLSPLAPATGQILKYNGTTWAPAADDNTGSLSSVGLAMPSIFTVTNSPLTADGTITTTLQSQTANTIFAAPNGAAGTPTFRALVAADIPSLPFSKITGTVPVAQGGTALTAVGAAGTVLTSNGTSLTYTAPSVTLAGDVTGASGTNTIAAKAVTYAKIQDVTTQKILGRYTAGTGTVQEVSLDNSLKLNTAGTLYADSSLAIWNASALQGRRVSAVAPTDNYVLKWDATNSSWGPELEAAATNWLFTGNSNTTATSFLGTTVDQPMVLKYNNKELFRGTKGVGLYVSKTVSLFNGATVYNGHPVIIRANGPDVLAFQDSTGVIKWHWNLLGTGLNFVESNVADYRLFLQNGGNVGINTSTPAATLDVEGTVQLGVGGSVLTNIIKATVTTTAAGNVLSATPLLVTFNVTGATNTSTVMVSPQAALPGGIAIGAAYVLTAGVVTIKFINTVATTSLPNNSKFNVTIIN